MGWCECRTANPLTMTMMIDIWMEKDTAFEQRAMHVRRRATCNLVEMSASQAELSPIKRNEVGSRFMKEEAVKPIRFEFKRASQETTRAARGHLTCVAVFKTIHVSYAG